MSSNMLPLYRISAPILSGTDTAGTSCKINDYDFLSVSFVFCTISHCKPNVQNIWWKKRYHLLRAGCWQEGEERVSAAKGFAFPTANPFWNMSFECNINFIVRLTVRGGGWAPSSPDRKPILKYWPIISIEIWFFDTQNTFYLVVKVLKKSIFHALFVIASDHLNQLFYCSCMAKFSFVILFVKVLVD